MPRFAAPTSPRAPRPRATREALCDALAHWLPRGLCQLCALPSRAPLCSACEERYLGASAARCPRCAARAPCGACMLAPPPFARTLTLGDYAPPLDRVIARLKFGAQPALGHWLGALLGQRWAAARLPRPDRVVAVPLSDARLRARGYNQAWEIARGLAATLRLHADATLLGRCRDTAAQSSLPRTQRADNVRGAFVVRGRARLARVLLVDDVMTSGCTLQAAAGALLRAGAAEVAVAVALRTPAPE